MQIEVKEPLYKRLNKERVQGEWEYCIHAYGKDFKATILTDNQRLEVCKFYWMETSKSESELPDKTAKANAEYTALAVNNLHLIVEALENAMERMERARSILKRGPDSNWGILDTSDLKEAINKIS